jgi:hypothetical protein
MAMSMRTPQRRKLPRAGRRGAAERGTWFRTRRAALRMPAPRFLRGTRALRARGRRGRRMVCGAGPRLLPPVCGMHAFHSGVCENRLLRRTRAELAHVFGRQIKDATSIFMEVEEEDYAKLVAKRRQDEFVEDDGDDLGYKDDGEEAWNRSVCLRRCTPPLLLTIYPPRAM